MTVSQVLKRVEQFKPMSRSNIYAHFRALNIKPLGVARPVRYPDDAADKVLIRLGFLPATPEPTPIRERRKPLLKRTRKTSYSSMMSDAARKATR
jgi:hypothetical protein